MLKRVSLSLPSLLLLGLALLVTPPTRAEGEKEEEIVMMSAYEVTAQSAEFEGWVKLTTPNFVVYTDAPAKEVRPHLQRMEKVYLVSQMILGRKPSYDDPFVIILPTQDSDWKKLRSMGRVDWKVGVSTWGRFYPGTLLEYDWQETGSYGMWWAMGNLVPDRLGMIWARPLGRGVGDFYETMQPSKAGIKVGKMNPSIRALTHLGFLPWDQFFARSTSTKAYRKGGRDLAQYDAQSTLFFHYWFMEKSPDGLPKLLDWNTRLLTGVDPSEAEFREVFGMDYTELQEVMRAYQRRSRHTVHDYNVPDQIMNFVVTEREVKASEMRELFVLIQIRNQNIEESVVALDSLLAKGLKSTELQPLLVEVCLQRDRDATALELIESMVEQGDATTPVLVWRALLTRRQHMPRVELSNRITLDEMARMQRLLEPALERVPHDVRTNEAWSWMLAMQETISPEDLDELRANCRRVDGHGDTSEVLAALAWASWRAGDEATARRLVELLKDSPYTVKWIREFAAELEAAMEALVTG